MDAPPRQLDGADVLQYVVSERGAYYEIRGTEPIERVVAMAICRYDGAAGFYHFGCNSNWEVVSDVDCESIEEGVRIAANFAKGETLNWIVPDA